MLECFEQHRSLGRDDPNDVPATTSKRVQRKPSKLDDFTCHGEDHEEQGRKVPKSKQPKKTDSRESRDNKLKTVGDKAKVQQALFKEMLTCKVCS